jgi:Ca-activated chloride channel family protein
LVFSISGFKAHAQQKTKVDTRILFLFDASGSMYARMDKDSRINVAKRILSNIMDSLSKFQNIEVGLRVFGHRQTPAQWDCEDTKLEVPFKPNNHQEIKAKIKTIVPKGTTLIAYSLLQSANDFPVEAKVRNVVILITDGIEECKGDPCAISQALQSKGVILRPFVIGLGSTEEFRSAFECVGHYYDANTEDAFESVLKVVVTQAMNITTAHVNLLDGFSKPTETNVNMAFYNSKTKKLLHNFYHTMNEKGKPDTLFLDPNFTYRLVVNTIPPVVKDKIEINAGKHNIIGVDVPQGSLNFKITGMNVYPDLKCIIRESGDEKTLHVQNVSTTEKYIVGKYDIEILTTPRIVYKNLQLKENAVTSLEIPQPGKLMVVAFNKFYLADIYLMSGNEQVFVSRMSIDSRNTNIVLQPGVYKFVYRPKDSYRSAQTFEREFEIKSGSTTNMTF